MDSSSLLPSAQQNPEKGEAVSSYPLVLRRDVLQAQKQSRKMIEGIVEAARFPKPRRVGEKEVLFVREGKRLQVKYAESGQQVLVNAQRFSSYERAIRTGLSQAAVLQTRDLLLQRNPQKFSKAVEESPQQKDGVMKLRAMQYLQDYEPAVASELLGLEIEHLSFLQQFDQACEDFLLSGEIPRNLSPQVRELFMKTFKKGKNLLSMIANPGRTFSSSCQLFQKHLEPLREAVKNIQGNQSETERDEYVPPPASGESEPIDPDSIETRVEPYKGGYYRGQVFNFDQQSHRLVSVSSPKSSWLPSDLPENMDEYRRYRYSSVFHPDKENILELPYNALPLPITLDSSADFEIMRSRKGVYSIVPREGRKISASQALSFQFIIAKTSENQLDDEPEAEEQQFLPGDMGEHAESLLSQLEGEKNAIMSPVDKARSVVSAVRQHLLYPKEEQVGEMNAQYAASGASLMADIGENKIADCHWSNNYAAQICRRLGVPARVPTGHMVQRDPGFEFAAVAGIGHAWLEVWDEAQSLWVKLDATPPFQPDDERNEEEEEDENDSEESEAEEGEVLPMELEDLKKLIEAAEQAEPISSDEIMAQMFRERTGVNREDWKKVESFIKEVNQTQIPKDDQISESGAFLQRFSPFITAKKGTLEREWQKLFAMICEQRRIKKQAFRGPVRQSESESGDIHDVVEVVTDMLSGDMDPGGFRMRAEKTKTFLHAKRFEDDALVDLTASMESRDESGKVMKIEQKKVILSMLYQLMRMNEKLNSSSMKMNLREPLELKSRILSIHGERGDNNGRWSELKSSEESITEAALVHLARDLDDTTAGVGNFFSSLRAYKLALSERQLKDMKSGRLVKFLTIYSDGNIGGYGGDDAQNIAQTRQLVQELRDLGVVVQGIGFTESAQAIIPICQDSSDSDAAVVLTDSSKALFARHRVLAKHLKGLTKKRG